MGRAPHRKVCVCVCVAVALLFAVVQMGCRAQWMEAPPATVGRFGTEQAVAEARARKWSRPDPQRFDSVLDYVLATLVERAYPAPDRAALVRAATGALAGAASARGGRSTRRLATEWAKEVTAAGSFEPALADPAWRGDSDRAAGIEAGLGAMLGDVAWLLPADRAASLRNLLSARQGGEPAKRVSFTLRRVRPDVAYVLIPTFEDEDIGFRVARALRGELNAGARAVLIDLRDNPGGRPEQADAVADLFLDHRPLHTLRFADGGRVTFVTHAGASKAAVAVLVNRQTGSAAEMLAMALKDNGRALLVGERTAGMLFGKDYADLPDGRAIVFRCEPTVLSPSGADYSLRGVPPDVPVAEGKAGGEAPFIAAALEALSLTSTGSDRR